MDPQGPVTAAERTLLFNSVGIMLTVVIPVITATLGVAFWYRASNGRARYRPTWTYSGRVEIVTWSIPAMIIFLLGGVAWIGSHRLDPARHLEISSKPLQVQVVSLNWKWLFIYPEMGVASVNRLVVPASTPISLTLTSATVMNSFFVPQLAGQIYTMTGMETQLNLLADYPGQYPGLSSQFSGDGFSGMRFIVESVLPNQFEAWITATRGDGPSLDTESYRKLSKPSSYVTPFTYRAIDSTLFDAIVAMKPGVAFMSPSDRMAPQDVTTENSKGL